MIKDLNAEQLRLRVSYDPETGEFRWINSHLFRGHRNICDGDIAGVFNKVLGYIKIGLFGKQYFAHRLAYLYMIGEWPEGEIDHRDGNKTNNKFSNLRNASKAENRRNIGLRSTNKSGIKGVSFDIKRQKWHACISINSKNYTIGRFDSLEEAALARRNYANEIYKDFAKENL